ncbi:hypothetical protein CEP53_005935 [Fusarium sp. AF-6]|nr:hypothetical protein CEP53_005935 [Fusarium sp. AF-6]
MYFEQGQLDKAIELMQYVVAMHERSRSFEKDAIPLLQALRKLRNFSNLMKDMQEIAGYYLPSGHLARRSSWPWLVDAFLANAQIPEAYELLQKLYEAEDGTEQSRVCRLIREYYLQIASEDWRHTAMIKTLEYEIEILQKTALSRDPALLFKLDFLGRTTRCHLHLQRGLELAQYMLAMVEDGWVANPTLRLAGDELISSRMINGDSAVRAWILQTTSLLWSQDHPKMILTSLALQNQVAEAFLEEGQTVRAMRILRHTAEMWKVEGAWDGNYQLLEVQHNLGMAYHRLGHRRRAMKLLEHVAGFRRTTLPEDNMRRVKTEKLLEVVRQEMEGAGETGGR